MTPTDRKRMTDYLLARAWREMPDGRWRDHCGLLSGLPLFDTMPLADAYAFQRAHTDACDVVRS